MTPAHAGEAAAADPAGLACARCQRPLRIPSKSHPPPPDPRGRVWAAIRCWPDGWICSGCYARACETYGTCEGCTAHRLLPGVGPAGQRWCTDCAGGIEGLRCDRCGQEGWPHYRRVCGRCVLTERLTDALDDGTGRIRPELVALFDLVVAMRRPRSGILWLSKPHVIPILRAVAHGEVDLTHEGISSLTPWRSASHLRDLLVAAGILPPVDRFLFRFEQWLPGWLEKIPDDEHRKQLKHYATWRVLRRLRQSAATKPIGHYRNQNARQQLRIGAEFLEYLAASNTTLADCDQAVLDRWLAHAIPTHRALLKPFLRWAIDTRRMPRLTVPPTCQAPVALISQRQRIELIRRVHHGEGMDLLERVVALLILLYAQDLTRIVKLTLDDIVVDGEQLFIRLGDPPAPVPAPFDAIVRAHLADRPNMHTAGNPGSTLLFPGRSPSQPLHPTSIRRRLHLLGIPNLNSRSRALRELLLQAPPAVVAGMIGYGTNRAEAIAREAGTTWKHYAAGDHSPTRGPRSPS